MTLISTARHDVQKGILCFGLIAAAMSQKGCDSVEHRPGENPEITAKMRVDEQRDRLEIWLAAANPTWVELGSVELNLVLTDGTRARLLGDSLDCGATLYFFIEPGPFADRVIWFDWDFGPARPDSGSMTFRDKEARLHQVPLGAAQGDEPRNWTKTKR